MNTSLDNSPPPLARVFHGNTCPSLKQGSGSSHNGESKQIIRDHRRRIRQKRRHKGRRCCLGDVLECPAFSSKNDLKKSFWKNIHFGRMGVCCTYIYCSVNWMIIHFSKASIPPSVRSSMHPFLQIIPVLNF